MLARVIYLESVIFFKEAYTTGTIFLNHSKNEAKIA